MRYLLALLLAISVVGCEGDDDSGSDDDDGDDDSEAVCIEGTAYWEEVILEICSSTDCMNDCITWPLDEPKPPDVTYHEVWECECFCAWDRWLCVTEEHGCPWGPAGECWDDPDVDLCPASEQDCYDHNPYDAGV